MGWCRWRLRVLARRVRRRERGGGGLGEILWQRGERGGGGEGGQDREGGACPSRSGRSGTGRHWPRHGPSPGAAATRPQAAKAAISAAADRRHLRRPASTRGAAARVHLHGPSAGGGGGGIRAAVRRASTGPVAAGPTSAGGGSAALAMGGGCVNELSPMGNLDH
jgi:hypothetical protein